jgi:hypothetical protein
MKIDRLFQILAVALGGAAAYFLWVGNKDGAFISAVLGCVAFFLSVRFQVKARNSVREAEREAAYESEAAAASPESTD